MTYRGFCKEQLVSYKKRPFVDKDLQLQLPGTECPSEPSYLNHATTINEKELERVMQEAEQSFLAWQHMQQHLLGYISKH